MATTYSYQKGKYGGPCGSIFPYFIPMQNLSPLEQEYSDNIPAGYLRCRGQILNADQYPNLALVIGIGDSCIYRKTGTTLQNQVNGVGGQIQLPDLGSKYITASSTPGNYLNTTTTNTLTNSEIERAGVEVEIVSNANTSNQISFNYTGNFVLPQKDLPVNGQVRITAPSSTTRNTVGETEIMGHGHGSTLSTGREIQRFGECFNGSTAQRRPFPFTCNASLQASETVITGREWTTFQLDTYGSDAGTTHSHSGLFPRITSSTSTATIKRTEIPSSGLTTNVTFNKFNRFAIDRVSGKFILCEFLIKF